MRKKLLLTASCLLLLGWAFRAHATRVQLYMTEENCRLVNKATGKEVDMGEPEYSKYDFECEPGTYIYSQTYDNYYLYTAGSFEFTVKDPGEYDENGLQIQIGVRVLNVNMTTKDADGNNVTWQRGTDYTLGDITMTDRNGDRVNFTMGASELEGVTDENCLVFVGPHNAAVSLRLIPTALHPDYAVNDYETSLSSFYNPTSVKFSKLMTFSLSFPEDATGSLTYKRNQTHYVPFVDVEPVSETVADGMRTYTYSMAENSNLYSYRVTRPGCMTRAGIIQSNKTKEIVITDETLKEFTPRYLDRDLAQSGTHYSDIFLNINRRNQLDLKKGQTFQIVNLRTWQLTNSATANYFIEPDYHWTVLDTDFRPDQSVVSVDDHGVLTAHKAGTAIVQVRYDALGLGAMGGDKWSEIWAENTGTFVVTVDADTEAAPADNIRLAYKPDVPLDAEHDILYYMEDKPGYELTFTPAANTTVTVANPLVDTEKNEVTYPDGFSAKNVTVNADGSMTVMLTYGRNIIRVADAAGNASYQVLSAKPVTAKLVTGRLDNYILPGDDAKIQMSGMFHISGKLAGIYNNNTHLHFNDTIVEDGVIVGAGQYDFAGRATSQAFPFSVAPDYTGAEFPIVDGYLVAQGYGSAPGAHRAVTYTIGVDPNFNAGNLTGNFGSVPSQFVKVTQLKDVDRLSIYLPMGSRALPVKPEATKAAFGDKAVWKIGDATKIRVNNETGEVFPMAGGKTVMTLVSDENADPETAPLLVCDVEVENNPDFVPVTGIKWRNPYQSTTMNLSWGNWGNTASVYYDIEPANATNKTVIFTSSDPEAVCFTKKGASTVTKTGSPQLFWNEATKAPGKSTLRAETVDGSFVDEMVFEWMRGADRVTLSETALSLGVNDTHILTATVTPDNCSYPVVWTASDPEVATVDENGLVTALKEGECTITATATPMRGTCKVTVTKESGVGNITSDSAFRFWPNPAADILNIKTAKATTVSFYSLSGAKVLSADLEEGTTVLDISHLNKGIYLVETDGSVRKLIKE